MESQGKVSVWLDNLEEDCRPYSFFMDLWQMWMKTLWK